MVGSTLALRTYLLVICALGERTIQHVYCCICVQSLQPLPITRPTLLAAVNFFICTMATTDDFLSKFSERRSVYALSGESTISDERLEELVQKVLLAAPSAFNTQSTRIVVLLSDQHHKLWDIVHTALKPFVDGEQAVTTATKIKGFQGAYATVLFFEDPKPYEPLASFKIHADKFESWRDQGNAMHQFLLWTAISSEGLGGNLQHYNPLIDDEVTT
jgi:predicted oxidoreductase (fatty acid repression mutant protein)